MASEAQRIMNLSLTKIVSSRSRRGGVSLHRNLLVASVLFKARDVYAAEMAGLVVIRNGSVYDKKSLEYEELKPEIAAPDQSTDVDPETDDSIISEEEIQKTLNAVVTDPSSSLNNTSTSSPSNVSLDCDDDSESGKENVKPSDCNSNVNDSGKASLKPSKRSRKLPNKHCKKRQYSELEQSVISITDSTTGVSEKKKPRLESLSVAEHVTSIEEPQMSLNCNEELSSSLIEWPDNKISAADNRFSNPVQIMDYVSYANDETSSSSSHDDNDDKDNESVKYSDIGSYRRQSSCHAFSKDSYSSQSDSISFSLSHPVLVVSV